MSVIQSTNLDICLETYSMFPFNDIINKYEVDYCRRRNMKVLIIYASESKEYVEKLRNKIAEKYGKNSILRMNSRDRENKKRKSIFIHAWHKDACRMMKRADIIVYAVSPKSA